jgi:hypothetical protein
MRTPRLHAHECYESFLARRRSGGFRLRYFLPIRPDSNAKKLVIVTNVDSPVSKDELFLATRTGDLLHPNLRTTSLLQYCSIPVGAVIRHIVILQEDELGNMESPESPSIMHVPTAGHRSSRLVSFPRTSFREG